MNTEDTYTMKALILAAGFGKRLQPITNKIPKSMVEVNGTPLLCNALNNVTALGVSEVGIVVGHMADYIKEHIGSEWNGVPVRYFENKRYLETNNVVSLYMAEALLAGEGECSILVSPFNPLTMDGTVIRVDGDKALELILGKWQYDGFDYSKTRKTVNMYKFKKDFVKDKYMPLVRWYVEHMGKNSYYEKVLGSLMYYRECDFRIVEVPEDMWCEIDDAYDLKRARARFGK